MNWASGAEGEPAVGWEAPDSNASIGLFKHAYYAAAAYSDSLMGELLAELAAHGMENDTIVVMTADHGWGRRAHIHGWSSIVLCVALCCVVLCCVVLCCVVLCCVVLCCVVLCCVVVTLCLCCQVLVSTTIGSSIPTGKRTQG